MLAYGPFTSILNTWQDRVLPDTRHTVLGVKKTNNRCSMISHNEFIIFLYGSRTRSTLHHQETSEHIQLMKTAGQHFWDIYGGLDCTANLSLGVVLISHTRGRIILQVDLFLKACSWLEKHETCLATAKIIYTMRRRFWVVSEIKLKFIYEVVRNWPLFGVLPLCLCNSIGGCVSKTDHLDIPIMLGTNKTSSRPTSSWDSSSFSVHLFICQVL